MPGDIVLTGGLGSAAAWSAVADDELLIKIGLAFIALPVLAITFVMVAGLEPGQGLAEVMRSWLARTGGPGVAGVVVVALVGVLDVRRSPVTAMVLLIVAIPPLVVEVRNRWAGADRRWPPPDLPSASASDRQRH